MKKILLFAVVLSLFCVCTVNNVYAQELTVVQKIERAYDDFLKNEKVVKFTSKTKAGWEAFKKWFNNLPGIRHYNNSVYSSKNWKAAMNNSPSSNNSSVQGICPTGWHLPSDSDWIHLEDYVSSRSEYKCDSIFIYWIAKSLADNIGWNTYNDQICAVGYNQSDNNATGFTVRPAGYYIGESYFYPLGGLASFWSSTEANGIDTQTGHYATAYSRAITYGASAVIHQENLLEQALSVRCLKD